MWSTFTFILAATIVVAPLLWETAVFVLALFAGVAYGIFSLACIWPCFVWGSLFGRIRMMQRVGPFFLPALLLFLIFGHKTDPAVWLLLSYLGCTVGAVLLSPRRAFAMSLSSGMALSTTIAELASDWAASTSRSIESLREGLFNTGAMAFARKGLAAFENSYSPPAYLNQDLANLKTRISPFASLSRCNLLSWFPSVDFCEFRQTVSDRCCKRLTQLTCAAGVAALLSLPMIYLLRFQSDLWRVNEASAKPIIAAQSAPGDFSIGANARVRDGYGEPSEITSRNGTLDGNTGSILSLGGLSRALSFGSFRIAGDEIARDQLPGAGAPFWLSGATGWADRYMSQRAFDSTALESQPQPHAKHTEAPPSGKSENAAKSDNETEPAVRRNSADPGLQKGTNDLRRTKQSNAAKVEVLEQATAYVTDRRIPVRDEARFGAAVSAEVPSGESVAVVARDGDWMRIKIPRSERVGYVRKEYILAVSSGQNHKVNNSRSPSDGFQIAGSRSSPDQQD